MINPKTQQFMAGRMRAKTRLSRVDHSPMYTATDLVTDLILEAARHMGSAENETPQLKEMRQ